MLNEHLTQMTQFNKKTAASPSNAASSDNYFKGLSKPKQSVAKHKKRDVLNADIHHAAAAQAAKRGGSVSKLDAKMAE